MCIAPLNAMHVLHAISSRIFIPLNIDFILLELDFAGLLLGRSRWRLDVIR